jgi:dimethylaniline monooxygenase (N-oxide forming)
MAYPLLSAMNRVNMSAEAIPHQSRVRTCVIGAGIAGLTAVKALKDRGLSVDCYERCAEIGGLWLYREDDREFSIYKSCHTIGCKHFMAFDDFAIPQTYPEYPSHQQMLEYLRNYAVKFGLYENIHLNQEITDARLTDRQKWQVTINNGSTKTYDNLIVGSGQFFWPRYPSFKNNFCGDALHSAYYRHPDRYRGKKVLIVGLGNTAVDLTNDLVGVAEKILVSTRAGAHFIPKFILGKPFLHYTSPIDDYMPFRFLQLLAHLLNFVGRGSLRSYGVSKPKVDILIKNPTVSSTFLDHVGHGNVLLKPGIRELQEHSVLFDDGTRHDIDAVIYATGFTVRFPFFSDSLIAYTREKFCNYMHILNLEYPNLYFAGFVNPVGTYPKVFELQARCIAGLVSHELRVPDISDMVNEFRKSEMKMRRRYNEFHEPMITVEYFRYLRQLRTWLRTKKA